MENVHICDPLGKAVGRPQPGPSAEPGSPQSEQNSITVLREQLETTSDANEAQYSAPGPGATT